MSLAAGKGEEKGPALTSSSKVDWAKVRPKSLVYEDTVLTKPVNELWGEIYRRVGARDESQQAETRLAIYAYCAVNGTSREGNYEGVMVTASGLRVSASVVPAVVGKYYIRRFLRANADESYEALKASGVLADDNRFVVRAADLGVPSAAAIAMCDWLVESPKLNPLETTHAMRVFTNKRGGAAVNRGGALETIEQTRAAEVVGAVGANNEADGAGRSVAGRAAW